MLKITKNQGSIQVTADNSGFYPFDGTLTFPTNSLFTATSANTDMITFKSTSNGDVQFVGNYKDITISGRSYDTKQKFLTAFSNLANLANQGSVDAYTKAETDAKIDAKQGKLKAGNGITLTEDATDGTTVVKTAVSLTDNGNGAYTVGDSIGIGGRSSVRIGDNNNVLQGQNSIIIGDHALTNAEKCIAIGNSSVVNVNSTCSIVIGDSARADGQQNIAIGDNRSCEGTKNVSIGCGKLDTIDVNGQSNVCIGENSNVHKKDNTTVNESVAIGKNARSESSSSVAIGTNAFSKQFHGIAIGSGAGATADDKVTNSDSIAIGTFSRADGNCSIAIGDYSNSKKGGVAIGENGKATAEKGIAIGEWALASVENGVAIGELAQTAADKPLVIRAGNKTVDGRKLPITMIQGDANGKISIIKGDGTDERIVIQDEIEALKNAGGGGSVDAYTKAETDTKLDAKQDKLTAGSGITITKDETAGTSTIATAVSLTDNGNGAYQVGNSIKMGNGIAIGSGATSPSAKSIAIGKSANINPDDIESVAVGYKANAAESYSVAIGSGSTASRPYDVSVGYNCVSQSNSVAIGKEAYAVGGSAVAIGNNATADSISNGSIAIGYVADARGMSTVAIGSSAGASNTTPLTINAGCKTVDGRKLPITMIQGDANGKISLLKGDGSDERIVIQDEIEALKNAGGGGSVDAYTKTETDNLLNAKQNTLTAGTGITIDENNVISSTGGSGGSANPYVNVKGTNAGATIADYVTDGVAIGSGTNVSGGRGIAIGTGSVSQGNDSIAIGNAASADTYGSIAIGNASSVDSENCIAIGSNAVNTGIDCISIGYHSHAGETDDVGSVIIGNNANGTSGTTSTLIGYSANSSGLGCTGIGTMATVNDTTPLAINAGYKMVNDYIQILTMIQGDANGKISLLKGDGSDERIVIQDEIAALKAEIAALKGGASTGGTTGA